MAGHDLHGSFGVGNRNSFIERSVIHPCIDCITLRRCSRFQGVRSRSPAQLHFPIVIEQCGESLHRQRLDRIAYFVAARQVFEQTFVHGPTDGKAECGVEPVFHIGKVLVRKEFQKHCRHISCARFAIRPVP